MNTTGQFSVSLKDGTPVIRIEGDLDHNSAPELRSLVAGLIDEGRRTIAIDMAAVEFLDSGGMSGIIFSLKRLSALGGHLTLVNPNPRVFRKMQIGGLTSMTDLLTITSVEHDTDVEKPE